MNKLQKKIFVNSLTCSRIVGAFFIPLIFSKVSITGLVILLAVLFISDFLDGKLARKWEVQTIGGSILDPFGDKILALFCMFALIGANKKLIFLLVAELTISIINIVRILRGSNVKTSLLGKAKTWFLSITLILGAVNLFNPKLFYNIFAFIGIKASFLIISTDFVDSAFYMAVGAELMTLVAYIIETSKEKRSETKVTLKPINVKKLLKRLFDETKFKEDREKPFSEILKKVRG